MKRELDEKMINPYYFTVRSLQVGFNITLDSHHINHSKSKLTIRPNFSESEIELRYINKGLKGMSVFYARIINQYKVKYRTVSSAKFDKQDEDNQVFDETELFINLNVNHNLTESDIDNFDIKSPLEQQMRNQELKHSEWRLDKTNSMTIYF